MKPYFMFELSAYTFLLEFIHSKREQAYSGILWNHRIRYADDRQKNLLWFRSRLFREGNWSPHYRQLGIPPVTRRLGMSLSGGGKRRIFAIGNYINQRCLKPIHDLTGFLANKQTTADKTTGANNATRFCCIRERSTIVCREL